jgi:hypothetical protein
MSTTPRTDEATYPADCLGKTLVVNRNCAAALETELTRLRALFPAILAALRNGGCCTTDVSVEFLECVPNEVASVVSQLRAEVERLKGMASWAHTCIHHNDAERAGAACPCCAITRAEKAEAKIITARSALSRIANSDYRGNRSTESQIAFAALEEIK